MNWKTISRPGQTGLDKKIIENDLNLKYGIGNWRRVHLFDGRIYSKPEVFSICEESYYLDSFKNEAEWEKLLSVAKDVYDMKPEEIESGCDYTKQHEFTRFHDICIRNVLNRRSWKFNGSELVQIRLERTQVKPIDRFDPGKILFHKPESIIRPRISGWWDKDSVEDFYQSNKILQVMDK